MNFSSLWFRNSLLKIPRLNIPGLKSSWLKSLGLKSLRFGVEKSGVEMFFNRYGILRFQKVKGSGLILDFLGFLDSLV